MFFIQYLLPFFVALTILVFIHELGHYLFARKYGVRVEVFSIGFGPEVFGFFDKHGTRWKFSIIPLGGYVRMFGDADAASRPDSEGIANMSVHERSLTLQSKPIMQRIMVSLGGPLANFLFALVAMFFLFAIKGEPVIKTSIMEVKENSVAMSIGLKSGDVIKAFQGKAVSTFKELKSAIQTVEGNDISVDIERDGAPLTLSLKRTTPFEKPFQLGIVPSSPEFERKSIRDAVISSFSMVYESSMDIIVMVKQMIIGERKGNELGGILAIGEMAGKSAQSSAATFVWFLALLSVNLGMLNLFPIPMLDGGHIALYAIEGMIGRPVPLKVQEYIFLGGFGIVASLMLYVTWNDLSRYKIFEMISNLF